MKLIDRLLLLVGISPPTGRHLLRNIPPRPQTVYWVTTLSDPISPVAAWLNAGVEINEDSDAVR